MKTINYNKELSFLKQQEAFFIGLKKIQNHYSKGTIEYFNSILMLEESIFNKKEYDSYISNIKLFYEIAKFNIIWKTVSTINKSRLIDQNKLLAEINNNGLSITYFSDIDNSFKVFDSYFNKQANIDLFEIISSEETEQSTTTNTVLKYILKDWDMKFNEKELTKTLTWATIHKNQLITK